MNSEKPEYEAVNIERGLRLSQARKARKLSGEQLGAIIGVSRAQISNLEKGANALKDKNAKLICQKLDINFEWLWNGEGEMEGDGQNILPVQPFITGTEKRHEIQLVPLYDVTASAGLTSIYNSTNNILDYLQIPNLPRCDGAIYVKGDSMYPLLKHGDMVAFQRLVDLPDDIDYGSMYVVDMSTPTLERIFVKYVQKSEKGEDYVKLVSYNSKFHADMDVPLAKIRAMAAVKASIRLS